MFCGSVPVLVEKTWIISIFVVTPWIDCETVRHVRQIDRSIVRQCSRQTEHAALRVGGVKSVNSFDNTPTRNEVWY